MSEPLSDERLKECRDTFKSYAMTGRIDQRVADLLTAFGDVLAEVDRLRTPRGLTEQDRQRLQDMAVVLAKAKRLKTPITGFQCDLECLLQMIARLQAEIEFRDKLIHDLKEESLAYRLGADEERKACMSLFDAMHADHVKHVGEVALRVASAKIASAQQVKS